MVFADESHINDAEIFFVNKDRYCDIDFIVRFMHWEGVNFFNQIEKY